MKNTKEYLGDAVYADLTPFDELILTTEDGIEATNVIYLELSVVQALLRYITLHFTKEQV